MEVVVIQFKLLLWIFLTAFLLLMPLVQGKDFRYCSNRGYPVKITGVTVSPDPVFRGKLITYTFSASTDQVIFGGEMVIDISYYSFHIHSKKHNLCDETSCPVSVGDFGISLSQVLPVYAAPATWLSQKSGVGSSEDILNFVRSVRNQHPYTLESSNDHCCNDNVHVRLSRFGHELTGNNDCGSNF